MPTPIDDHMPHVTLAHKLGEGVRKPMEKCLREIPASVASLTIISEWIRAMRRDGISMVGIRDILLASVEICIGMANGIPPTDEQVHLIVELQKQG